MTIVLTVLKVLLFIVLILLGILVFLLSLILFVPFRYHGEAKYHEEIPDVRFSYSWFLRIFSGNYRLDDDGSENDCRFFGKTLKDDSGKVADFLKKKTEKINHKKEKKTKNEEENKLSEDLSFIDRMNEKWQNKKDRLLKKWDSLYENLEEIRKKLRFIQNDRTDRTIHLILKKAGKLLKHVFPQKISGNISFGFSSPDTTGKILGILGFLSPLHHDRICIEPDFTKQTLDGEVRFRGRIRIGTIVVLIISVLINRDFRITRKRYKKYFDSSKEVKHG